MDSLLFQQSTGTSLDHLRKALKSAKDKVNWKIARMLHKVFPFGKRKRAKRMAKQMELIEDLDNLNVVFEDLEACFKELPVTM